MKRLLLFLPLATFAHAASASCWAPVTAQSKVSFSASQAGEAMPGEFKSYDGSICLGEPGKDQVNVTVQTSSADSGLPELDDALRGPDFFDSSRWPQARFTSSAVKALGNGQYQVSGNLTIRDVAKPVSLTVSFVPAVDGKSAKLSGSLSLKRLDYGVGRGQWADTKWVGDQVDLKFDVTLKPVPGQ